MRKLIALAVMACPVLVWGANTSLTVSSGTFLAVDGFSPANTNFRQAITIADPNVTGGVAPVDPVTGLAVHLTSSSLTNSGIPITQSGTFTETPGTGTWPVSQSGTFTETPGTGTWPVSVATAVQLASGTATNPFSITGSISNTSFNVYQPSPSTVTVLQAIQLASGTATNPFTITGSISNTGFNVNNAPTVVQSTAGVNGSTIAVVNAVGTTLSVTFPSAQSVTGSVNAYLPSPSTVTVLQAVQLASGTATNPLNVTGSINVYQASPSTVTVLQAIQLTSGNVTNPFYAHEPSTLNTVSTFTTIVSTYADNGALANANRFGVLPAIYGSDYLDGSAATDDFNAALFVGTRDGGLRTTQIMNFTDHSYSVSTGPFTVPNSTIDVSGICGNATNNVGIVGIRVSATQTTAGIVPLLIVRRSTQYTGIYSTMVASGYDPTTYSVPLSSAIFFNSTDGHQLNGTYLTTLDSYNLGIMATGTATPNDIYISPASWRTDPPVLRGVTQCIAVSTNGNVVSGGKFNVSWFWKEVVAP
jgi:hypothetical protein